MVYTLFISPTEIVVEKLLVNFQTQANKQTNKQRGFEGNHKTSFRTLQFPHHHQPPCV